MSHPESAHWTYGAVDTGGEEEEEERDEGDQLMETSGVRFVLFPEKETGRPNIPAFFRSVAFDSRSRRSRRIHFGIRRRIEQTDA